MKLIRKIHRYIGWVLGIALFLWVMSGILMMLEEPTPDAIAKRKTFTHDFTAVSLSTAQVIDKFAEVRGSPEKINRVTLRTMRDKLIFDVRARGQAPLLIDAISGEPFEITPELALEITRDNVQSDLGEPEISIIEEHGPTYPWGALPAYKLAFEDGRGTIAYVALSDANFRVTDRTKQFWHLLLSLHTFNPINFIFGNDVRRQVMFIASGLALIIVITGYYMEIAPRARNRRKK